MKFKIEKDKLQNAISNVQKAITGKSTMPILQGIYIKAVDNKLTLIGSDIEVTIETTLGAEVIENGEVVVDSRIFGDIIRKLPNAEIEVSQIGNNTIQINCLKSNVELLHMNGTDYPALPSIDEDVELSISQKILKNMIKSTIFSISQEDTRPILGGVLFEIKDRKLNLIALDGYRVAIKGENIDTNIVKDAVVPGKTLNEVSKILSDNDDNVEITFTENHILFTIGDTKIVSRLLEGKFINYSAIIPKEYNLKVEVNRLEMLNCIERASLVAKEGNTNPVKLDIQDDMIIVTSNSQLGKAREEINAKMQGDDLKIAFNSKYIIDILKIMEEESIILEFTSTITPCTIKNKEKDDCTYMILPVRIQNNN